MSKKIKLIIFDWSGTISDDRRPVHAANMEMAKHYGLPVYEFEEWLTRTTQTVREYFIQKGVKATPDAIWEFYKRSLRKVLESGLKPTIYEDVVYVLKKLKDNKKELAVLSSHPEETLIKEAWDYGIFKYFQLIRGNIVNKDQGIIEICNQLSISLEDTIYVGDMIPDVIAAKKAGVGSIFLTRGYHNEEMIKPYNPDAIWSDLQGLLSL